MYTLLVYEIKPCIKETNDHLDIESLVKKCVSKCCSPSYYCEMTPLHLMFPFVVNSLDTIDTLHFIFCNILPKVENQWWRH